VDFLIGLDGLYFYRNRDGSTYFNSGRGYTEYVAPDRTRFCTHYEPGTVTENATTTYNACHGEYYNRHRIEEQYEEYEGELDAGEESTGYVEADVDDRFEDYLLSGYMEFYDGDGNDLNIFVEQDEWDPYYLGDFPSGDSVCPDMDASFDLEEGMVDDSVDGNHDYEDGGGLQYEAEEEYGRYDDGGYKENCYYDFDDC